MTKPFGAIAFTDAVKELQEKNGSRASYARVEKKAHRDGLGPNETAFIATMDHFYMASYSESQFPYIQHRGGPKGFVRVLDKNRIGFIDFSGNRQYISAGNIQTNNHVALIMVDYPSRARLKILATAEIVELKENDELFALLNLDDYTFTPERMMVLQIEAYDWNCQQHIIPRYTIEEIQEAFAGEQLKVTALQHENQLLKKKLQNAGISIDDVQ